MKYTDNDIPPLPPSSHSWRSTNIISVRGGPAGVDPTLFLRHNIFGLAVWPLCFLATTLRSTLPTWPRVRYHNSCRTSSDPFSRVNGSVFPSLRYFLYPPHEQKRVVEFSLAVNIHVKLRFHNRFIYEGVDISIYVLLTGGRS